MKVRCDNGLCDRLRFMFSYLLKARQLDQELTVCWIPNVKCNGNFLDLFQPVQNVTFTTDTTDCDIFDWRPCAEFDPQKVFLYNDLHMRDELENRTTEMVSRLGRYIAIHARRTDKITYNGLDSVTPDSEFFRFIDQYSEVNIFLATDNSNTQKVFKQKYGDKLFYLSEIVPSNSTEIEFRETSLDLAVIDLFVCTKAWQFLGTNISGFSRVIEQFRKVKRRKEILFL